VEGEVGRWFVGPYGVRTFSALFLPLLTFLDKVSAADELDTECIAVFLSVADGSEEESGLTSQVGLVGSADGQLVLLEACTDGRRCVM